MPPIGVYLHIPFCLRKCPYCDFYSLSFSEGAADTYTRALVRAIELQPFGEIACDTLYFGGGTPCLLGAQRLGDVISAARNHLGLTGNAEITLEANPGAVSPQQLADMRQAGFTRISFGVQSMLDAELAALGRIHTANEAREAILAAHAAGFAHISADVMLGIPLQTPKSLAQSLSALTALPISHLSAYLLKIEEHTPFFAQKNALPNEDTAAELYLNCVSLLKKAGFAQYEISNFAKSGAVSRHNLKYWRCESYLGLGPAAHSFVNGKRFYFPPDAAAFQNAADPFALLVQDGAGGDAEEALLLGLRLCEGIDAASLQSRFGINAAALLHGACAPNFGGLVTVNGSNISLTPEGFLLSNSIIATLLQQAF